MQDESQEVSAENNKIPEMEIAIEEIKEDPEDGIPAAVEKDIVQEPETSLMEVDEEVPKTEEGIEIIELPDSGKATPEENTEINRISRPLQKIESVMELEGVEDKEEKKAKEIPNEKESENSDDVEMISVPAEVEPDTEAVSEDELPTEATAKVSFNLFL